MIAHSYIRIPQYMRPGLIRYVHLGVKPGQFLLAVLHNNFCDACSRADHENQPLLDVYAGLLCVVLPAPAWGSEEKVSQWMQDQRQRPFEWDGVEWPVSWKDDVDTIRRESEGEI